MTHTIEIAGRPVGPGQPAYIIAEIGINHNGDVALAQKLIDAAVLADCDAVKFQKRDPDTCVPPCQRQLIRETPWGNMTYLEYRHRMEFGRAEYAAIAEYCRKKSIAWFASSWDLPSVEFLAEFDVPCYKIPSACLTDDALLARTRSLGRPVMLSTGMSDMSEIRHAVQLLDRRRLLIAHATSTYPCPPAELNLRVIPALAAEFDCPIGYSGHEVGLQTSYAAVVVGASFLERHITVDRAMWGSDQAASVEPAGLIRLVRDIRIIEKALGDGIKRVYESELAARRRLRLIQSVAQPA
ncbi:MAG TPA: N-acetylneuraminate synthase family protein [Candidatus Acidoferrales bacterium]|nr:N-acetylneuraminate synthase family protein [Candidatus Acidoferrales bacterium]